MQQNEHRNVARKAANGLLRWSTSASSASFPERYAAACKKLRDLFDKEGEVPPMLLFEENGDLDAYMIDDIGHVHRVHRSIVWEKAQTTEGAASQSSDEEVEFIQDGAVPTSAPEFIDQADEHGPGAVEHAHHERVLQERAQKRRRPNAGGEQC